MSNVIEVMPRKTTTKSGERYKLYIQDGQLLTGTPSWSTENGAKRWAVKNGYAIAPPRSTAKKTAYLTSCNGYIELLINGRWFEFRTRTRAIEYAKSIFSDVTIVDETEDK